jgi:hypothetical protein
MVVWNSQLIFAMSQLTAAPTAILRMDGEYVLLEVLEVGKQLAFPGTMYSFAM